MISIGATAAGKKTKNYDGTAFSKWNEGLEDRFSYEYDSPEEPPLASTPNPTSGEVAPLTLDQLTAISTAFDDSTLDKYRGIDVIDEWASPVFGWMMERDSVSTTWGGLTKEGKRDVEKCPITDTDYKNVTWSDYATKVRRKVISNALKNAQKGEVKEYYSEMTDIARTYIEESVKVPAMESTSSELIAAMKKAISEKKMFINRQENLDGNIRMR